MHPVNSSFFFIFSRYFSLLKRDQFKFQRRLYLSRMVTKNKRKWSKIKDLNLIAFLIHKLFTEPETRNSRVEWQYLSSIK